MKKWAALCLGALLLCSWAASSPEQESSSGYSLEARGVSGRLSVTRDVTYSLSFQGGQVDLGGKTLQAGCFPGRLRRGAVLSFQRVGRVQFHIPSRGCPRR